MFESLEAVDNPIADAFWRDGHYSVDALVSSEQCAFVRQCMDAAQKAGRMRLANTQAFQGPNNQYAPIPGQVILGSLAPTLSAMVGCTLLPSFAFWRIYEEGAVLNPHQDRNACEVSATITIASEPADQIWPIGVTDLHGCDHDVAIPTGSGMLYQGTKVTHWRAPLVGGRQYQMFLHYVVAGGPFEALLHDRGTARMP